MNLQIDSLIILRNENELNRQKFSSFKIEEDWLNNLYKSILNENDLINLKFTSLLEKSDNTDSQYKSLSEEYDKLNKRYELLSNLIDISKRIANKFQPSNLSIPENKNVTSIFNDTSKEIIPLISRLKKYELIDKVNLPLDSLFPSVEASYHSRGNSDAAQSNSY
jgi:hypothetical protein